MIIFPAIDMRQGKCVRLLQGRADQETVYFQDPVAVAHRWEAGGAAWLHLVDLDGAMSDGSGNRAIAKRIFGALRIPVQFGGGVRSMEDVEEILEAGAARVVVGTAAVQHPEFLAEAVQRFGNLTNDIVERTANFAARQLPLMSPVADGDVIDARGAVPLR